MMNKAKKIWMIMLAMTVLFASTACADAKRVGVLLAPGAQEKIAHRQAEHAVEIEYTYYDNLASALLGLQRGHVDVFGSEGAAAEYIVLRHENMAMTAPSDRLQIDYAMMTMTDKQEIFDILDGALREMKADGTIDRLIENELRAYIETDAEPKELPHFEGAQTIRIAVTGDVPPMDFITASGKPAAEVADCATTIEGNDAMQFNVGSITVPSSCTEFTINLKHVGQMPVAAMGHNVVISKASDRAGIGADGASAGAANGYIKEGDERVIAHSDMIGGGQSTSVTFPVSAIQGDGPYEFFCSFPGHWAVMRGSIEVG